MGHLRVVLDEAHAEQTTKVLLGPWDLGLSEAHKALLLDPNLALADDVAQVLHLFLE